jgi:hypothetical protein
LQNPIYNPGVIAPLHTFCKYLVHVLVRQITFRILHESFP